MIQLIALLVMLAGAIMLEPNPSGVWDVMGVVLVTGGATVRSFVWVVKTARGE